MKILNLLIFLTCVSAFADSEMRTLKGESLRIVRLNEGDAIYALVYRDRRLEADEFRFVKRDGVVIVERWQYARKDLEFNSQYLPTDVLGIRALSERELERIDKTLERCRTPLPLDYNIDQATYIRLSYIRKGAVIGEEIWPLPRLIATIDYLDRRKADLLEWREQVHRLALEEGISYEEVTSYFPLGSIFRVEYERYIQQR